MNQTLSSAVDAIVVPREPLVLRVIEYPDPRLEALATPVIVGTNISSSELKNLLDDMEATLRANHAQGLAAVQVGAPLRVAVVQSELGNVMKLINPRIVDSDGSTYEREGCLSLPGLFVRVVRPAEVVVEYLDENLEKRTTALAGILARAVVHEVDHLDGKTFLDRVSGVERQGAIRKHKLQKRKVTNLVNRLTGH